MIHETFGEMLYFPEKPLNELPSPEYLKKRILISTKPPKEYLEAKMNENENENDWVRGDDSEDEGQWGIRVSSCFLSIYSFVFHVIIKWCLIFTLYFLCFGYYIRMILRIWKKMARNDINILNISG